MCIEAALICQAFFVLSIFFQVLMHRQSQILKNPYLWKVIYIVLIVSLVMQKLEGWLEKMRAGSGALERAIVLGLIIQKGFAQLHGSAGPRHNLAMTGKPVYFALNYFLSCFSSSGFIF